MEFDWAEAHVLVTGGSGFLGSRVVARLRARGAKQITVPRSRDCDLVDIANIRALLARARPTIVFHLAARVGGIGGNRENPARFFYDNLMMGVQVLHESHLAGVQKLVATGSVCAYPKWCPVPFREEDIWNGYPEETNAPYGIAKKALSVQSDAYRRQYGFRSIVVYPVNLYGPGDDYDLDTSHVIPALLRKFNEAKVRGEREVTVWGDGSPTREFLYVDDCAEAIVLAAESYDSSQPLNLGSGVEISIKDLAERIAKLVGFEGRILWDGTKPNGQPRRRVDVSRAIAHLGFRASTSLDDGLRTTNAWIVESLARG